MAAEGGAIITFIFNGEDSADIPRDITHLIIHENITVIPTRLFWKHPNVVEVYCHTGVTKIKQKAFWGCRSLRRVIIPGVTIVERFAFNGCRNLIYIECGKLEIIGAWSFSRCEVLGSINLPSAKIVERGAFCGRLAMTEAIFGKDLESIGGMAFMNCTSLESITVPLMNGILPEDNIFNRCSNLKRVDLVEGEALRNFADGLLLEDWKSDMNEVLDSVNQILPNTAAGSEHYHDDVGGKAITIREWIESVLRKVTHYKSAHHELLNEAATALQLSLPNDIVMNNILSFIELPPLTVDGEDEAE